MITKGKYKNRKLAAAPGAFPMSSPLTNPKHASVKKNAIPTINPFNLNMILYTLMYSPVRTTW